MIRNPRMGFGSAPVLRRSVADLVASEGFTPVSAESTVPPPAAAPVRTGWDRVNDPFFGSRRAPSTPLTDPSHPLVAEAIRIEAAGGGVGPMAPPSISTLLSFSLTNSSMTASMLASFVSSLLPSELDWLSSRTMIVTRSCRLMTRGSGTGTAV